MLISVLNGEIINKLEFRNKVTAYQKNHKTEFVTLKQKETH